MAWRRIIRRTGNSPITTFPIAIKTESERLIASGKLISRTEEFDTTPGAMPANGFISTITEVWLTQTECNNFKQWTADNHSSVFEAWKITNNIADTLISSGEI